MRFVALIRGINVGGKNLIAMGELVKAVTKCDYKNVTSYIQSGNIIFESENVNLNMIARKLEMCIQKDFKHTTKVVVLTDKILREVIRQAPANWPKEDNIRKYIAFVIPPTEVEEATKDITMRLGVDKLKTGKNVLYMSTQLNGLTRSGFNKLATKKVYKSLTIRNFNTISKLYENTCSLMKQKKK